VGAQQLILLLLAQPTLVVVEVQVALEGFQASQAVQVSLSSELPLEHLSLFQRA
jgi:hypothetical protein